MDSGIYCRQIFENSAIVLADMAAVNRTGMLRLV